MVQPPWVLKVRGPGLAHALFFWGFFLLFNCPFCLTMFEDGIKGADVEDKLNTKDIAEVLAERLI